MADSSPSNLCWPNCSIATSRIGARTASSLVLLSAVLTVCTAICPPENGSDAQLFGIGIVRNGKADDCANLGPSGLGIPVAKGPWGRDFGVVRSVTEALSAGFVRLYGPDQEGGRIKCTAVRGGHDEVRNAP